MCGLFGVINLSGYLKFEINIAEKMANSLYHRGPNDAGLYFDNNVFLGHTRLSIIDLEGGAQPISNEDNSLWIIFNGEIFNYPELRNELLHKGHIFKTQSDTEVILHLFEEKRENVVDFLNGQFAFVIWNNKTKEIFAARDRTGIIPFFYKRCNDNIIFGSEIKAILAYHDGDDKIDLKSLSQIFSMWAPIPGKTIFENIFELPPAHFLYIQGNRLEIKRYWDMDFSASTVIKTNTEKIVEELHELLLESIKIRLRADVPVASYLSGGLDSSGITALVKAHFNNSLRTFGIGFKETNFDESYHQNIVAAYLGTEHYEKSISNEEIGLKFEETVCAAEKPILRTAPIPMLYLSEIVKESGFKVALTGEGADEIFGGYNIFKETLVRHFISNDESSELRPLLIKKLYPYLFKDDRLNSSLQSFFKIGIDRPNDTFFSHERRWSSTSKIKLFFNNDVTESIKNYNYLSELKELLPNNFNSWDHISKAQYLETIIFMSNYLLSSQGDRVAMQNSIELRTPFLDHRIIDYMSKIHFTLKIRGLNEKYLLKKVFKKYLPKETIHRMKNPFRAPVKNSLLSNKFLIEKYCSHEAISNSGIFNFNKVQMLIRKIMSEKDCSEVDNMAIAGIISMQIIYEKFIKNFRIQSGKRHHFSNVYNLVQNP